MKSPQPASHPMAEAECSPEVGARPRHPLPARTLTQVQVRGPQRGGEGAALCSGRGPQQPCGGQQLSRQGSGKRAVAPRSAPAGSEANTVLRGFQGSHLCATAALMQP